MLFSRVLLLLSCRALLLLLSFIILFRHKSILQARSREAVFCKVTWKRLIRMKPLCHIAQLHSFLHHLYDTFATALCARCVENGLQRDPTSSVISKLPSSPGILSTIKHKKHTLLSAHPPKKNTTQEHFWEATTYSAMTLFGSKSRPVPWLTDFIEKDSFTLSPRIWKTGKKQLRSMTCSHPRHCMSIVCVCVCYLSSNNFDPNLLPNINNLRGFLDASGWHLTHMYQTWRITAKKCHIYA